MRKIDADHLKKKIKLVVCDSDNSVYRDALNDILDFVMPQLIDDEPTVEDNEDTAHWEICCDGYYPYCSECKEEPPGREMSKYCPNCGRKMVNK